MWRAAASAYSATAARFTLEVAGHGGAQGRIGEPVRGPGEGRLEAARELVLALRAGLEALQAVADAVLDALVVAGLEMQAVESAAAPQ